MKPRLQELYEKNIKDNLKKDLNIKNSHLVPKLRKIILNVGIGSAHANPKRLETAMKELAAITGQKSIKTYAKKSIAGFKIREGMVMGCCVTLRRSRMYEFLDRLISLAIPRVRDFRGISPRAFDGHGNYNFSIKEHIIFPEIDFDKVESVHGMNISIVTSTDDDSHAFELLKKFNMPFRK
jgi:large subunit ribosomal protein L5